MFAGMAVRGWLCVLVALPLPIVIAQEAGNGGDRMQGVQALVDKAKIAAEAQNAFGLKLLARVAMERRHENVFVSPSSIFLALAMLENGAAGKTRVAMRHTLEVPAGVSDDAMQESAAAMLKALRSHDGIELSIANALWSDRSMPLAAAFVQRCRDLYEADAITLEFLKPGAAEVINNWVRQKTRQKISNIVSPQIVAASKAILTNAVYFKGRWSDPFSKQATRDGTFHLVNGTQKTVPFMWQPALHGAYRSGDGFEAAVLPYERSGMALCAILPAPGKSPEEALAKVSIDKLIRGYEPFDLELRLPRFTLDFSDSLKQPLGQMGMGIAFQFPGAEFAPLGSPLFYIGDVLHKTRLEVDEEGTVAAAATAIAMPTDMAPRRVEKKTLVFDRPFALLLCDASTGAILFAGVVYEP
jgi:serpin B